MGSYSIHKLMFTLFTIVHISSLTSADWLFPPYVEPPQAPGPGDTKPCFEWVQFYGFGPNTVLNRTLAETRERRHDNVVSIWAVMYAQVLLAFSFLGVRHRDDRYTPLIYCAQFDEYANNIEFKTFISTEKTCKEWVQFYGYYLNERYIMNVFHNEFRNEDEDYNISVWAAGYARFISERKRKNKDIITIAEYCSGMGLSDNQIMKFMSFNETAQSCKAWIELSEYGTDFDINQQKFQEHKKRFNKYINLPTKLYIDHLSEYYAPKLIAFACASSSANLPENGPQTPEQFCNSNDMYDDIHFSYFGIRVIPNSN